MQGFKTNIEKDTIKNKNFRKVLYTSAHSQLVLMTLIPKQEIGVETHSENDQFFRFEAGRGRVEIDGNKYTVKDGIIYDAKRLLNDVRDMVAEEKRKRGITQLAQP